MTQRLTCQKIKHFDDHQAILCLSPVTVNICVCVCVCNIYIYIYIYIYIERERERAGTKKCRAPPPKKKNLFVGPFILKAVVLVMAFSADSIAKLSSLSCEIVDRRYVLIRVSVEKLISRVRGTQFKQISLD